MQINKSYETAEGTVKFNGEIEGVELDAILTLGLHQLIVRGLVKPKVVSPEQMHETPENLQ
jgi:hypothetical protein